MIQILEKHVAAKIAAGEVVDRPLSVVKELMENSIDAGADSIVVEIKKGGKSYIRITDNGCGIASDEVKLAFARHATSKITTDKDLESIRTLGFRGEALASICAVSTVELLTKRREDTLGTKCVVSGGDINDCKPYGCPDGTTIIVNNLFYNTPARLKFMKADNTESSLIIDFVSQMAIAYPNIKIRLINNENVLFSTNGKGNLLNTIMTVYSKSIGGDLVLVDYTEDYATITGYVSSPAFSKTSRKNQIFFVNGRDVSSKVIEKGLNSAYSDRLFEGRYPVAFLFVEVEPSKLDVNIHPNKKEIRFDDEAFISNFIEKAIKNALASKESIPQVKTENIFKNTTFNNSKEEVIKPVDINSLLSTLRAESDLDQTESLNQSSNTNTNTVCENKSQNTYISSQPAEKVIDNPIENPADKPIFKGLIPNINGLKPFNFNDLRPVGALFATYILAVDDDSFYLIDQHAAHERIFFEKLLSEFLNEEKHSQPVMLPIILNVSHSIAANPDIWLNPLISMGYEIEEFGINTYIVKAVPMFMTLQESEDFINSFLDSTEDSGTLIDNTKLERIITKSCKSAVKANDRLHDEEIKELINELTKCKNPYSCPHGRPTFIRMTKYEIEKIFKRV